MKSWTGHVSPWCTISVCDEGGGSVRQRGPVYFFFFQMQILTIAHTITYIYTHFYSSSPDPPYPTTHSYTHFTSSLRLCGLSGKRTCHLCRLISMHIHHRRPQVDRYHYHHHHHRHRHLLRVLAAAGNAYSNNKKITAVGTKEKSARVQGGTMRERVRGLSRRRRRLPS